MKTKIEIKSVFGKLLFEFEKENNTVKDTLIEANLRGANLYGANLYGANLREANLYGADLYRANLCEADLRGADLRGANLREANLRGADLYRANLCGADLRGAENISEAYLPIFCKWELAIKGDLIKIGCKEKTIEQWNLFFESTEEFSTKRDTEEFKQIQACYLAYKAYFEFLKK